MLAKLVRVTTRNCSTIRRKYSTNALALLEEMRMLPAVNGQDPIEHGKKCMKAVCLSGDHDLAAPALLHGFTNQASNLLTTNFGVNPHVLIPLSIMPEIIRYERALKLMQRAETVAVRDSLRKYCANITAMPGFPESWLIHNVSQCMASCDTPSGVSDAEVLSVIDACMIPSYCEITGMPTS